MCALFYFLKRVWCVVQNDQNVCLCAHDFFKQVLCFIKMHFLQVPVVAYCNTVYMYCLTKHVIKTNDALINWCWNFKNRTNVCSFCYVSLGRKRKKITHRIVNDKEKMTRKKSVNIMHSVTADKWWYSVTDDKQWFYVQLKDFSECICIWIDRCLH